MATSIQDLPTPCFLVDKEKVEKNCRKMLQTCKNLNLSLRPHTKTHKTVELAEMSTGGTKRCITVSTLLEAEFFADAGFDDILFAYPITADKIDRCLPLIKRLDSFHVMVSDLAGVECLKKTKSKLPGGKTWSVAIEIDAVYGRTGFLPSSDEFRTAFEAIISNMSLLSLYSHCGASYDITTRKDREVHHMMVVNEMTFGKDRILREFPETKVAIGVGSTPSCNIASEYHGRLNEFHPGCYIFNDYEQTLLSSCRQGDIACRVMTRVVAHKVEKSMIIVDCGFLALGQDGMHQRPHDFCIIEGEANLKLIDMTQELGKIKAKEGELDCRNYPVGSILYIYPFHSCLTAALHNKYYVHSGDKLVDTWTPVKFW